MKPVISLQSSVNSQDSSAVSCRLSAVGKIRKAFSKAAGRYDELATLQQAVGLRFLSQLQSERPQAILDIGMGTGWFTNNLCLEFPSVKVAGIDFASGMVECARQKNSRFKIIQAEAEHLPFNDERFDMVVSNLAFQWVGDLEKTFQEIRRTLTGNGVFYFSAFGQKSLSELFTAIEKSGNNGRAEEFTPKTLPAKEDYTNALLKAGFSNLHVACENFKVYFSDATSLLRWLKDIGANTNENRAFWGKDRFSRVAETYRANFSEKGKVVASFEVVWGKAQKSSVVRRQSSD